MSEEAQIISNDIKKTDLKSFLLNNKKKIIVIMAIILLALFAYFFYADYKKDQKLQISQQYNSAVINYNNNSSSSISEMKIIINIKDPTYSPLALYFLLDNNLLSNKDEVNQYFDLLIKDVKLEKEIINLLIFKKGLYNSETASEDELLQIFYPLINSDNVWKSHALYIIAEYFFSKNEKQKSKEFFEKILELENSNPQIKLEAQKRLQRDFSV
jgi:hypothetical protein|tara:strand:+ start:10791 stop:11432 length:642 start_codon:yes stop_codon:yes gene_type:complete